MTPDEIARLAALGTALRPNWREQSLRTFITDNLRWHSYGDTAVALAWVAAKELDSETPKLLLKSGPWWEASNADGHMVRQPPHKHEECAKHAGEYRLSCRGCGADRKIHSVPLTAEGRLNRGEALAAMRAQVADARQQTARDAAPAVEEEA